MKENKLPTIAYKETINLMGHILEINVLDNGQRVFEKESLEKFFKAIGFMPDDI